MPSADAIFPEGFVWGAATAAYQIEGAVREDGRGPSIWDTFSHTPGKTLNGDTGDVACDHYHRVPEDVALMGELGLGAYRFSVAWPRVFPDGAGRPNAAGLDFYRRLVETVRAAGIEPFLTLYHWDLPQALQDAGGWANRDTAKRFGEYAHAVATALGGGVHRWITLNEPWVAAFLGHLTGDHAPGTRDLRTALAAAHHLLLAHAEATAALRAELRAGDEVGITLNLAPVEPAGDANADAEAADRQDAYLNRWFLDPLFRGSYPADLLARFGDDAPPIEPGDPERIAAPLDFLGVNYSFRSVVAHDPAAPPVGARQVTPPGRPTTATGWEIYPEGLFETLSRVGRDYAPPALYVTENGAAFPDRLVDGAVDDPEREAYLHDHLLQAYRAIEAGVPLRGYFAWSLMDNFEWAFGYARRFGLVHVDYATQTRTIKRSGRWYAGVTRENGVRG
jgi:beta-glucosidase